MRLVLTHVCVCVFFFFFLITSIFIFNGNVKQSLGNKSCKIRLTMAIFALRTQLYFRPLLLFPENWRPYATTQAYGWKTQDGRMTESKMPLSLHVDIGSLLYALVNVFHPDGLIRSNFRLRRSDNLHKILTETRGYMWRKTGNAQSRATFFHHFAVLSLPAVLLRKVSPFRWREATARNTSAFAG